MNRSTSSLLALALLAGLGATAEAHEPGPAALDLSTADGQVTASYSLALADLAAVVDDVDPNGDGFLSELEAPQAAAALSAHLRQALSVRAGDRALTPSIHGPLFPNQRAVSFAADRTRVGVVLTYSANSSDLRVAYAPPAESELPPTLVVEFPDGSSSVLGATQREAAWAQTGLLRELGAFLLQGVWHILIGWDHLAFLLALLIMAKKPREVLGLVTAFTLAHSVTLALVALQFTSPPAAIVEAIIALSIAYVAVENLVVKEARWRWLMTFAFGLIHGMGFGGVLLELDLSRPVPALIGFNLGVELGQLAVVGLVFPLLVLIRKRPTLYKTVVLRGASVGLACLGIVCFLSRIELI